MVVVAMHVLLLLLPLPLGWCSQQPRFVRWSLGWWLVASMVD